MTSQEKTFRPLGDSLGDFPEPPPDYDPTERLSYCECNEGPSPGCYCRAGFHMQPRRGAEDFPSSDVVVRACPRYQAAEAQLRAAKADLKRIDEAWENAGKDHQVGLDQSTMNRLNAMTNDAKDEIARVARIQRRLRGDDPNHPGRTVRF